MLASFPASICLLYNCTIPISSPSAAAAVDVCVRLSKPQINFCIELFFFFFFFPLRNSDLLTPQWSETQKQEMNFDPCGIYRDWFINFTTQISEYMQQPVQSRKYDIMQQTQKKKNFFAKVFIFIFLIVFTELKKQRTEVKFYVTAADFHI